MLYQSFGFEISGSNIQIFCQRLENVFEDAGWKIWIAQDKETTIPSE